VSGVVAFQRKKPAAIGVKAPFPGFIEPALASSIERVPAGERWIHEIKFDGIYVGRLNGKDLVHAGKVDLGFDAASAKDLQARLKPQIRKSQPYARKIAHRAIWVEPSLLAEVEYRPLIANLRQPRQPCEKSSKLPKSRDGLTLEACRCWEGPRAPPPPTPSKVVPLA
jgi:ATP-dependent DNA ligase